VDESLKDLRVDAKRRHRVMALWVPQWLSGFGIATISAQIFVILTWSKLIVRKSQNQDLRVHPAWSIKLNRKIESRPGDFPGFR